MCWNGFKLWPDLQTFLVETIPYDVFDLEQKYRTEYRNDPD